MSDYKFRTRTGAVLDFLEPDPAVIHLEDIAHALSNNCRFAGQVDKFYSVAQHSVLVSRYVPAEDALWGLLHDGSEAYMNDLPRYLKRVPGMEKYMELEKLLMDAICDRFGLAHEQPASVTEADRLLVYAEYSQLFSNKTNLVAIPEDVRTPPESVIVNPWFPCEAKAAFLERFYELKTR